jgi:CRISPR-associated endonuclease Csn1
MALTLGLDLGTSSIGWALVDEYNHIIIDIGIRYFIEGVDNLGEGENELSKNAGRRLNRGIRKSAYRKKLRKRYLLKLLAQHGLAPLTINDIRHWMLNGDFPATEAITDWLKLNPYTLRSKALTEVLQPFELGRIFYHLIQRRGFLSNSRNETDDEGVIYEGDPASGKEGINATEAGIAQSAQQTLGGYLHSLYPPESTDGKKVSYQTTGHRIRNRFTKRSHYIQEFERIYAAQQQLTNGNSPFTAALFGALRGKKPDGRDGILFFQRELKVQKFLIGKCTFEPAKRRSPLSSLPFELFRSHQFVNTIEYNGQKLSDTERQKAVDLLLSKDKITFKQLRKAIGKTDPLYKFNYQDEDKVVGSWTISNLASKKYFSSQWQTFSDKEKEDIWHVLYFFNDKDKLKSYAQQHWGFDEEKADLIKNFRLKQGYSALSRKAILNILPFLQMGFTYDLAVVFGGIKNAFGETAWQQLPDAEKALLYDNVPGIVQQGKQGGFIEDLKKELRLHFGLSDAQLKKLYHHSSAIEQGVLLPLLPIGAKADKELQSLRNPVVVQTLFELRKLVNEIIQVYGRPDTIKVELARDLKTNKTQRNKVRLEQKRLERLNDTYIGRLREEGKYVTHDNILKYKLWEECQHTCPYTGNKIGLADLFNGRYEIEHIFPFSRSADNSFMNKTLCEATFNKTKGNLTPYEYFTKFEPAKWEAVKQRALSLFYDTKDFPDRYKKFKRFVAEKFDEDFVQRQLNDTRYMSREAKNYLSKICGKIIVSTGQATANLRYHWGLNSILSHDDNKTRDDHRHHAVDALVMAVVNQGMVQQMALWNQYKKDQAPKMFPLPWENFRTEAAEKINGILVSHKARTKILTSNVKKSVKNGVAYQNKSVAARGELHEATVFGRRTAPGRETAYHVRKPIQNLTPAAIPKIVDDRIRALVVERLQAFGIGFHEKSGKALAETKEQKEAFAKALAEPLYLPVNTEKRLKKLGTADASSVGDATPIKKVRLRENLGSPAQLADERNQFVSPGNNHHVLVYMDEAGKMQEQVVTFWEVAERKNQGQDVYQLPPDGKSLVTVLKANDMFLLGLQEEDINWEAPNYTLLANHLYRVQKFTAGDYYFRLHKAATLNNDEERKYIKNFGTGITGWQTHNPIKVKLSSMGKITKA